jgi:hypothetical protein
MDEAHDSPFDFALKESETGDDHSETYSHGLGLHGNELSYSVPHKPEQPSFVKDIQYSQNDDAVANCHFPPSASEELSPSIIPHRGSLRRIIDPSSFNAVQNSIPGISNQLQQATSRWPVYAINVATECSQNSWGGSDQQLHQCYQIIFDRQQYEFCTRLFSFLDTESESFIGPDCIREFVSLHCPVIRRRDDAIFALRRSEEQDERKCRSPTFHEIWELTIYSDPQLTCADASNRATHRVGIEGWMVFCRILALACHQESQRRFASRHLQQMMRHKHGVGATRMNSNEVVVVVDNPPPGPPALISISSLVEVEQDRVTSHSDECIQGWPFCPLQLPDLDLDQYLESGFSNHQQQLTMHPKPRGRVSIEPFSSSQEGDFILRFHSNGASAIVRRSYSDFEWLNSILKLHKRPGQGQLCGRVLPPFPSRQGGFLQQHSALPQKIAQPSDAYHQKDMSERAIEAAKSGISMISSMASSLWSGYVTCSTPASSPASSIAKSMSGQPGKLHLQTEATLKTAKSIERYINYLLESHALSSSFPLNAILHASQSGLESAKVVLHDQINCKKRRKSKLAAALSRDGPQSAATIFSAIVSKTSTSILRLQGDDDKSWLRSAAHVAMALQFHGILETTGHESTSAKIQHASLPKFSTRPACSWDDEDIGNDKASSKSKLSGCLQSDSPGSGTNFEVGVINVESELANEEDLEGYDMLPSPGPSDVHRVLNAGSGSTNLGITGSAFTYEAISEQPKEVCDRNDAVVGTIKVESDIDKLREIIQSINNTMGKLYHSSAAIRIAQDTRNDIQLNILRDVDSWGDNGGDIITQRALVNGVAALESFICDVKEINYTMTNGEKRLISKHAFFLKMFSSHHADDASSVDLITDLSWQSSLATSAVGAVFEVRDAIRASRTASSAKSAAYTAAGKAKKAYESCDHSSSMEKVKCAQVEASTTQSHAIHATVVEYEANLAKKRSAVSFSQDVKSWNNHRKNELLRTCIKAAKSQQEACKKAADAWESIREGLIDSSGYSFAELQVKPWDDLKRTSPVRSIPIADYLHANKQDALALRSQTNFDASNGNDVAQNSSDSDHWNNGQQMFSESVPEASNSMTSVVDGFTDICWLKESQKSEMEGSSDQIYCIVPPKTSLIDEDYFSFHQQSILIGEDDSNSDDADTNRTSSPHDSFHSGHNSTPDVPSRDKMSKSMQSLIDGLMTWGGEDDLGNNEESHETGNIIIGARDDAQFDDLLG